MVPLCPHCYVKRQSFSWSRLVALRHCSGRLNARPAHAVNTGQRRALKWWQRLLQTGINTELILPPLRLTSPPPSLPISLCTNSDREICLRAREHDVASIGHDSHIRLPSWSSGRVSGLVTTVRGCWLDSEQVASRLWAQANSFSYPQREGEWV